MHTLFLFPNTVFLILKSCCKCEGQSGVWCLSIPKQLLVTINNQSTWTLFAGRRATADGKLRNLHCSWSAQGTWKQQQFPSVTLPLAWRNQLLTAAKKPSQLENQPAGKSLLWGTSAMDQQPKAAKTWRSPPALFCYLDATVIDKQ